ncbi:hypothetical protein F2Q68_00012255 [Brassica cretica]|uniref:Uncharacterized protein n=1 Tax=Brassica cretica TaxID=69181 RepID=A0A8S9L2W6_BRACR|nr:hypothetical protein F2Q68_00012255 [Brassica cretica]
MNTQQKMIGSGKLSRSGGRARSCGGWMQRKRCGGARSWDRGHEGVAALAVKDVRTVVVQGFAEVAWNQEFHGGSFA